MAKGGHIDTDVVEGSPCCCCCCPDVGPGSGHVTCGHADPERVEHLWLRGRSNGESLICLRPQGSVLKSSKVGVANEVDRVVEIEVVIFRISFALETN